MRPHSTILKFCTICVLFSLCLMLSCKTDNPVTPERERVSALLSSGTWNIDNVTIDGVANTSFAGMTLVFTRTTYTTTNGDAVWPATGTWSFADDTAKVVKRGDDIEVAIEAISEASMTLSLMWTKTTLGAGRGKSLSGRHVFTFKK